MISNEEVTKINKAVTELPNQCRMIPFFSSGKQHEVQGGCPGARYISKDSGKSD
jgi:hypothetical protein